MNEAKPGPEALSSEQIDELHADLLQMQDQLTELVALSKESAEPVTLDQQSVGRVSRIDAIQQQQMAKANLAHNKRSLIRIEFILKLIAQDEYGFCADCDEPIGFARLKAQPDTPLCVRCKTAVESNN